MEPNEDMDGLKSLNLAETVPYVISQSHVGNANDTKREKD